MSMVCQPVPRHISQRPPAELNEKSRAVMPRETARAVRAKTCRISSHALIYVTGFERAERPSGLWSTSRRSPTFSSPSIRSCAPTSSDTRPLTLRA